MVPGSRQLSEIHPSDLDASNANGLGRWIWVSKMGCQWMHKTAHSWYENVYETLRFCGAAMFLALLRNLGAQAQVVLEMASDCLYEPDTTSTLSRTSNRNDID